MTALYPPAVRERWGVELSHEVSLAGIRSWPDTVAGAARLWLHPSDWPETFPGQTRRVLAVTLFAIIAVTGLLVRATEPQGVLAVDPRHFAASLWTAPILVGSGLAAPLPPLRWDALRRLTATAVRTLAAPALATLALYLVAQHIVVEHATGVAEAAQIAYYWTTLAFVSLRLCTLIARIAPATSPPTMRRLRGALLLIGTGLTLAAGQSLLAIAWTAPHSGLLIVTLLLALLAAVTIHTGLGLRTSERSGHQPARCYGEELDGPVHRSDFGDPR